MDLLTRRTSNSQASDGEQSHPSEKWNGKGDLGALSSPSAQRQLFETPLPLRPNRDRLGSSFSVVDTFTSAPKSVA